MQPHLIDLYTYYSIDVGVRTSKKQLMRYK